MWNCEVMATAKKCICCFEIDEIMEKMSELSNPVGCITLHPGFSTVCLDVWVLQVAYFQYQQQYGRLRLSAYRPNHIPFYSFKTRKYRYTGYRQLVRWCWGWLGKDVRVVLPSCDVTKIRRRFPSSTYTGFTDPEL